MKIILTLLSLTFLFSCAHHEVETLNFDYSSGSTKMKGFIAQPKDIKGKAPGVLVVHEWWGQTEYPRTRARQLAEMGYVAMAIDMYGNGQTAGHPKDAGKFAQKTMSDLPKAKKKFLAALDALKKNPKVDADKISAIGYCFGGAVVLSMARAGVDLDSVVSFHGSLPGHKFNPKKVTANILVINGEEDPFIKKEAIEKFNKEMSSVNTEYKFVNLPGETHGFTNPGATAKGKKFKLPLRYSQKADRDSWEMMERFFKKHM